MTEILPFTPLISLVCNLQIYTCFTSYDEKKRTLRQCFTSDLPFYPISCSFLRLFSPQHPLPYPTMEKIIQSKRYLGCHFNYLIGWLFLYCILSYLEFLWLALISPSPHSHLEIINHGKYLSFSTYSVDCIEITFDLPIWPLNGFWTTRMKTQPIFLHQKWPTSSFPSNSFKSMAFPGLGNSVLRA